MSEKNLMQRIRKLAPKYNCILLRNNVGHTITCDGRRIVFGLCKGSSDLIGWTIKNSIAVFTAIELKTTTGRASKEQLLFIDAVNKAGGIAGIVRSEEDFTKLICSSTSKP
jgi:hypothetical protein